MQDKIRNEAKKALESGEVKVVIGWGAGSVPFKTTPVFITKPDDVEKLVINPACTNNLAVYLQKAARDNKVAVIAKPCDIRSIVTLIREKQIKRENVHIIGLGCTGVIDSTKLEAANVSLCEIASLEWTSDGLKVTTSDDTITIPAADCLREQCLVCDNREPSLCDISIGDAVKRDESLSIDIPGLSEDRKAYWAEQFSHCIRCYACRQVCPACYCDTCFCDRIEPKWTAKKATTDEAWMFHATRVMHMAGRCVGCGECERACPMSIPIEELSRDMAKYIKDIYDYKAGLEDDPLLGTYKDTDYDPSEHE